MCYSCEIFNAWVQAHSVATRWAHLFAHTLVVGPKSDSKAHSIENLFAPSTVCTFPCYHDEFEKRDGIEIFLYETHCDGRICRARILTRANAWTSLPYAVFHYRYPLVFRAVFHVGRRLSEREAASKSMFPLLFWNASGGVSFEPGSRIIAKTWETTDVETSSLGWG